MMIWMSSEAWVIKICIFLNQNLAITAKVEAIFQLETVRVKFREKKIVPFVRVRAIFPRSKKFSQQLNLDEFVFRS